MLIICSRWDNSSSLPNLRNNLLHKLLSPRKAEQLQQDGLVPAVKPAIKVSSVLTVDSRSLHQRLVGLVLVGQ